MVTDKATPLAEFRQGFIDTFPLWLGVAPFGVAYALAAQTAGLTAWEVQAMSLLVFAGSAQFTAAGLIAGGADAFSIIVATLLINLRLLLYSTSVGTYVPRLKWWKKGILAHLLTDENYALTIKRVSEGKAGAALLIGSGVGLYVCWQLSTLIGLLLSSTIPDPNALGLQLVFPLSFTVMLLPYLRSRPAWAAAVTAGILAIVLRLIIPGNWYLLIAAIAGCLVGGWLDKTKPASVPSP